MKQADLACTGESIFDQQFETLTGNRPFPWQRELFERFVRDDLPASCDLPTGLGKTSIIAIWLIALASEPTKVPRRLVYVVNRRTVVDQSTDEAMKIRENLGKCPDVIRVLQSLCAIQDAPAEEQVCPLAISSLRGQFADNQEWLADPARPAIIAGTVDMIGSRLLFSGYRCGFKSKPTHAGLLGQDTLLVHDESHLEPAFQELLLAIEREQQEGRFPEHWPNRRIRVMELSATSRSDRRSDHKQSVFRLQTGDYENPVVQQRVHAKKGIVFHEVESEKEIADNVVAHALEHLKSGEAILIFLREIKNVEKVVAGLTKELKTHKLDKQIGQLTGTLRGWERDQLVTSPVFVRFLPESNRPKGVDPATGTVYLVCTAAGEVGVNISADHVVSDLTPFDSMAQRLGRVNRFGGENEQGVERDARIDIIYESDISNENTYHAAREKTVDLLKNLPVRDDGRLDASPDALAQLPPDERRDAFTPEPEILPVNDILFDAWAMTTISDDLPGRPPVEDWLHGITETDIPETYIAWREEVDEVDVVRKGVLDWQNPPLTRKELLEAYPLKPHELLRDATYRVFGHLQKLAAKHDDAPVWIVDRRGNVDKHTLRSLADPDVKGILAKRLRDMIAGQTVLLPPSIGGLSKGLLDGGAEFKENVPYDVADQWLDDSGRKRRLRFKHESELSEEDLATRATMRESLALTLNNPENESDDEDDTEPTCWRWFVRPQSAEDDAGSWRLKKNTKQVLHVHLTRAETFATQIVDAVQLVEPLRTAVIMAARFHDLGKDRRLWQIGVGNNQYRPDDPNRVWAKSGNSRPPLNKHYRHEFGSLLDLQGQPDFSSQPGGIRDLILHLVAAHHGRARPHFPQNEAFDPEAGDATAATVARDVPGRFARLQRKFGRWGLAWLESLVRATDVLASQSPDAAGVIEQTDRAFAEETA